MKKETIKNLAFWIMIGVVIFLCIFISFYIQSEGYECIKDPLVYGVNKFETSDNSIFTCVCSSQTSKGYLFITKENKTFINSFS